MYFQPLFSLVCSNGQPASNQPCPPVPSGAFFQQWFNGHGAPSGMLVNQSAGKPAWYQDLDTGIIWADPNGTGAWPPPFSPT